MPDTTQRDHPGGSSDRRKFGVITSRSQGPRSGPGLDPTSDHAIINQQMDPFPKTPDTPYGLAGQR
jgi:hypothetical protein